MLNLIVEIAPLELRMDVPQGDDDIFHIFHNGLQQHIQCDYLYDRTRS